MTHHAGAGGAAETARMLAALMGVDEDEAAERLQRRVLISAAATGRHQEWAGEIAALVNRTVVLTDDPGAADVELVVGPTAARSRARRLYADIDAAAARVGSAPVSCGQDDPHPLFAAVAACAAAAAAINAVVDDARLPATPDPLVVRRDEIGLPDTTAIAPIDLTGAVLVGAGAVAHGFMRAIRHLPVCGRLDIVDPKQVGAGNPNRCLYLTDKDLRDFKAEALARNAAVDVPRLTLNPLVTEFKDYAAELQNVPLAIVTIDSRRARRSLQLSVPGRVLDASTTDVRGVVVHSHIQPTDAACLACIYQHVPDEEARERSIAEGLGLTLTEVKAGFIDRTAAGKIAAHYGALALDPDALVGKAFDTLFRELCGAQALKTPEGRQVLTPFAFVSALAGALLAVELVRQTAGAADTNYWQVDPWRAPLARLRRRRSKAAGCVLCSRPDAKRVIETMWSGA